ncbi:MAG: trypsin-like peptidase domain-containing protein [Pseudonocardia sp.]|nr:trypsin-like peptidase domain-containing protein [Pseudonocardia sp.]
MPARTLRALTRSALAAALIAAALAGDTGRPATPVAAMWVAEAQPVAPATTTRPTAGTPAVPLDSDFASSTVGVLVVDGGTHQCSAAMVASESKRLLATAAHCVWWDGQWTLDGAYFVPGARDGDEPWGRWPVQAAWVPVSWQQARSSIESVASDHDIAFARLADRDGQLPEDVLGGQGIRFDAPRNMTVSALGYPAARQYDGSQLQRCTGQAQTQQMGEDGDQILVMSCDMTEGSSGGPWLAGDSATDGKGRIVGVVSGGSGPDLVSARLGREAEQVYADADAAADGAAGRD